MTQLPQSSSGEYRCCTDLNLYKSTTCEGLVTQALTGRCLTILSSQLNDRAIQVRLCEDDYEGWLSLEDLDRLEPTSIPYQPNSVTRTEIEAAIPAIIAFTKKAMKQPNHYLWGGTVPPNYDCSGLMQSAFAASGIWLPRDSYQQEEFTQKIQRDEVCPGDLIFFGNGIKVNHVALYIGNGKYIHSSGKDEGRNGIAIDPLSDQGDPISYSYYRRLWGYGRVMKSYQGSLEFRD